MVLGESKLKELNYTFDTKSDNYVNSIFEFDKIKNDVENLKKKSYKLDKEINQNIEMKYTLEINVILFVSVLSLIGFLSNFNILFFILKIRLPI